MIACERVEFDRGGGTILKKTNVRGFTKIFQALLNGKAIVAMPTIDCSNLVLRYRMMHRNSRLNSCVSVGLAPTGTSNWVATLVGGHL